MKFYVKILRPIIDSKFWKSIGRESWEKNEKYARNLVILPPSSQISATTNELV